MIINGKEIAEKISESLKKEIQESGRKLTMAAVLVGGNEELKRFVALKEKAAEKIGIGFKFFEASEKLSQEELISEIKKLSQDTAIDGILVELPLPDKYDTQKVLDAIVPEKDVDILTTENQKKFYNGDFSVLPPAVEALKNILNEIKLDVKGKQAVVFGVGQLVGKPVSRWFESEGARVSVIDIDTKHPEKISPQADILVSGVGKSRLIGVNMVKEGAVVIDFGYELTIDGVTGDVNFNSVSKKAGAITPVPGGVGPLVVMAVFRNLVKLSK
jgi:methylenetetrahydrofolate dehydrogenase (NADP+)/methenyltetrahydrofolate cyclohydrolase